MTDEAMIVPPLLRRVALRCTIPLIAQLLVLALMDWLPPILTPTELAISVENLLGRLLGIIFVAPSIISAWTVARWDEDGRLPFGKAVANAWLGAVIALFIPALIHDVLPSLGNGGAMLAAVMITYTLLLALPIAALTAIFRAVLPIRSAAPAD